MREPDTTESTSEEELIYTISHDLRSPLLNFQGFLRRLSGACQALDQRLQGPAASEEERRWCRQLLEEKVWPSLGVLERNARRMDQLLGALLELSRAGREALHLQPVNTAEVAREVAEEFGGAAVAIDAALSVEDMPEVWADPHRTRHVFRLLFSNALKFLDSGRPGRITAAGRIEGQEAICWVRDNGIGIRPFDQHRIFLPFGRVREIEGTGDGIGLAVAQKLMKQQQGRIWVHSIHGKGSTFFLGFLRCQQTA